MSWDDGFLEPPGFMSSRELEIFVGVTEGQPEVFQDETLQLLYHEALFDFDISSANRETTYDLLVDYLWDVYGIDFDEVMDWESYREWYDAV